ncbi:MAG: MmgE/PrpD family protein [Burkholderiales bacterium]
MQDKTSGADATARLAQHITAARYDRLAAGTVHAAKRALFDFLTCAVSGSAMPVSKTLLSYYEETDATRSAAVIGSKSRLSAPNAALVNGANTHGLDFDDGHTHASAHPAGAVFPAILAAAEQHGRSPRDILLAATIGYDVMVRIAAAMHPGSARRGWHNTAIGGVFGATAAVSSLLGLDAAQTRNALGLAASFAGGIREYLDDGAEIKRLHPGKAARDGLLCAEFARRGITGPAQALEGRYGFFNVFVGGEVKWDRLFEALGERYEIEGAYFKPYPCCRHYHAAIDGVLDLRAQQGFAPAEVALIDIGLYAVGVHGHDHKHCDNLLDAQMSAPCAAALAVVDGGIAAHNFLPDSLARPEVRRLIEASDTRIDPECERVYPGRRSGAVRLTLRDGRVLEQRVLDPRGEGENPMSDADLEHKFMVNCEPLLGAAKCRRLLDTAWHFDAAPDAGELRSW